MFDGVGILAGGADFTTKAGDAPSSVALALGAATLPFGTGNGGTEVTALWLSLVEPEGTGPPAYAGETTPTTSAAETTTEAKTLRRNSDSL